MLQHFGPQVINLLAAVLLLLAFAMLSQRRILSLINLFAAQGFVLFLSTALVAALTDQKHLYVSAAVTLVLKVTLLPWILHRLIRRLNVKWDVETLINIPTTMLVGILLVILAFNLAAPISQLAGTVTRSTRGTSRSSRSTDADRAPRPSAVAARWKRGSCPRRAPAARCGSKRRVQQPHLRRCRRARGARHRKRPACCAGRAAVRGLAQRLSRGSHRVRRDDDVFFFAALHAHRTRAQAGNRPRDAALPQHVPAVQLHDAARADDQQPWRDVGRHGSRNAYHGAARRALPHACLARGGVEVLHPLRRRNRPGAVRNHPRLLRRREGARPGNRIAAVDPPRRRQDRAAADRHVDRFRVPSGGLRHEGGTGTAAQLAARRAR